jgi:hypothetical protein
MLLTVCLAVPQVIRPLMDMVVVQHHQQRVRQQQEAAKLKARPVFTHPHQHLYHTPAPPPPPPQPQHLQERIEALKSTSAVMQLITDALQGAGSDADDMSRYLPSSVLTALGVVNPGQPGADGAERDSLTMEESRGDDGEHWGPGATSRGSFIAQVGGAKLWL